MIEFDVDMAYCEEAGDLDLVVLNDESGDMDSREFVPKANAPAYTSDGYHTFAELYEHRTGLLAALCNVAAGVMMTEGIEPEHMGCLIFKSWHHHDGEMYDGMFIVGINCNQRLGPWAKWATWHCEGKWWDRFNIPELDKAPEWDGHTPEEALDRLVRCFTPEKEAK